MLNASVLTVSAVIGLSVLLNLWRFMIDARWQGMGFGRQAMELLIDHVRTRPKAKELLTSVLQAPGGPQGFYEKLGFALTGEYEEGEAMMSLPLSGQAT